MIKILKYLTVLALTAILLYLIGYIKEGKVYPEPYYDDYIGYVPGWNGSTLRILAGIGFVVFIVLITSYFITESKERQR